MHCILLAPGVNIQVAKFYERKKTSINVYKSIAFHDF